MFVHLAVPVGQQVERAPAQPFRRALGGGLAGEPQIRADPAEEVTAP